MLADVDVRANEWAETLCGTESYVVRAVGICDLFVVVGCEQVGLAARQGVRRERGRHLIAPRAMSGAVPDVPAGHDLDNEVCAGFANAVSSGATPVDAP